MDTTNEERWSDSFLDPWREQGDPLADRLMQDLFARGDVARLDALMRQLVQNDDFPGGEVIPGLADYLEASAWLPKWADPEILEQAARFFTFRGKYVLIMLGLYALPMSYCADKGIKILFVGSQLHSDVKRRIMESLQMVVDVAAPGGLSRNGRGIRSIQKVRLMHAAHRVLIPRSPLYDPAWGLPVNQEDMAGTALAFGLSPSEGMPKIGIEVDPDDAEAYLHLWLVVASMLGLAPDVTPRDCADGRALWAAEERRHFRRCDEGVLMAQALLSDAYGGALPGMEHIIAPLIREFMGDKDADILDIPRHHVGRWLRELHELHIDAARVVSRRENASPTARAILSRAGDVLLDGMLKLPRRGNRPPFVISDELTQPWREAQ